jgi:hypothetical protein
MNTKSLDKEDKIYNVIKYTLSRFLKNNKVKKWINLNLEQVESFAKKYIMGKEQQCISKNSTLKGYVVKQFLYYLFRVIEAETGKQLPKILISRVTRTVKRFARPILAKYPQTKNRAKTFSLKTIKKVIDRAFTKNTTISYETALCLSLTFTTGCRLSDALNIFWKDIKLIKKKNSEFVKILLRNSKNNQLGIKPEQLTYKIGKNNIIKLESDLNYYLSKVELKSENLFNFANSKASKIKQITYQMRKLSKELNLRYTLGAHSGRNTMLLKLCHAGVDDESKKIYMRWTPNSSMANHYRGLLLECSELGASEQLAKINFNTNLDNEND